MRRAILTAVLIAGLIAGSAGARKPGEPIPTMEPPRNVGPRDGSLSPEPRFAIAAANTTLLASYDFDNGGLCSPQGWTVVDATEQVTTFWHVEDFVGANVNPGDSLAVLDGSKSLWCGARAAPLGLTCGYAALPGYGNLWDQVWQTKNCIPVTGTLDVSFMIETDAEPSYDTTYLEYTADCTGPTYVGWIWIDGGIGEWDGVHNAMTHTASYSNVPASVKVRLHFDSDGGWSDEDGLYDSHAGPIVIDNLVVEGLALEDFEDEAVGTTATGDWEAFLIPGYGASYMAQFPGFTQVQQDACAKNVSCLWAAILGSPWNYACGGFPLQKVVPRGNGRDQYIHAEIWSPVFPLVGTGSVVNLEFAVYRDLNIDALVFYDWGVRSLSSDGCASSWRDRNFVYYGDQKAWGVDTFLAGDLVDLSHVWMQVKIGVVDMCGVWCHGALLGCRSHAPLFDNVRVYRVDIFGPTFAVRDLEQFQDTFPTDGSDTGTGRADAAVSWQADASMTNIPADSATLICLDGITRYPAEVGGDPITGDRSGLAVDPELGGWQIYAWVRVVDSGVPQIAGPKFGANLQQLPRNPFKDTQVADGKTWTRIRMDRANNAASRWRVDLPDALFTAGDVIEYFYGATSTSGQTSYCSGSSLNFVQNDASVAAAAPSEFTILPLVPGASGSDILYIDGMDGRGAQQYWDASFANMGVGEPDRYDIRAPSSGVGNHPGARVEDVITQLNGNYKNILFDCGNLTNIVSDGTQNDKSDDYAMINVFLANLGGTPGGVFIGGDDALENLVATAGGSAATFKSVYITYNLTSTSAKNAGYGVAPQIIGRPVGGGGQGAFAGDSWIAYGGCAGINDFDVAEPTGSTVMQSSYGAFAGDNGADISQTTGNARVMMSGYAFQNVKDDNESGDTDRDDHLGDILVFLNNTPDQSTNAHSVAVNRLEQNYPNPFNPTTTIAFSIKQRSRVTVDVYNVAGERVRTLLDQTRAAGSYTDVRWDGTDATGSPVASGVYFYRLAAADFSQTRKMVLLK
jgi:FlgD Ig-like domain